MFGPGMNAAAEATFSIRPAPAATHMRHARCISDGQPPPC